MWGGVLLKWRGDKIPSCPHISSMGDGVGGHQDLEGPVWPWLVQGDAPDVPEMDARTMRFKIKKDVPDLKGLILDLTKQVLTELFVVPDAFRAAARVSPGPLKKSIDLAKEVAPAFAKTADLFFYRPPFVGEVKQLSAEGLRTSIGQMPRLASAIVSGINYRGGGAASYSGERTAHQGGSVALDPPRHRILAVPIIWKHAGNPLYRFYRNAGSGFLVLPVADDLVPGTRFYLAKPAVAIAKDDDQSLTVQNYLDFRAQMHHCEQRSKALAELATRKRNSVETSDTTGSVEGGTGATRMSFLAPSSSEDKASLDIFRESAPVLCPSSVGEDAGVVRADVEPAGSPPSTKKSSESPPQPSKRLSPLRRVHFEDENEVPPYSPSPEPSPYSPYSPTSEEFKSPEPEPEEERFDVELLTEIEAAELEKKKLFELQEYIGWRSAVAFFNDRDPETSMSPTSRGAAGQVAFLHDDDDPPTLSVRSPTGGVAPGPFLLDDAGVENTVVQILPRSSLQILPNDAGVENVAISPPAADGSTSTVLLEEDEADLLDRQIRLLLRGLQSQRDISTKTLTQEHEQVVWSTPSHLQEDVSSSPGMMSVLSSTSRTGAPASPTASSRRESQELILTLMQETLDARKQTSLSSSPSSVVAVPPSSSPSEDATPKPLSAMSTTPLLVPLSPPPPAPTAPSTCTTTILSDGPPTPGPSTPAPASGPSGAAGGAAAGAAPDLQLVLLQQSEHEHRTIRVIIVSGIVFLVLVFAAVVFFAACRSGREAPRVLKHRGSSRISRDAGGRGGSRSGGGRTRVRRIAGRSSTMSSSQGGSSESCSSEGGGGSDSFEDEDEKNRNGGRVRGQQASSRPRREPISDAHGPGYGVGGAFREDGTANLTRMTFPEMRLVYEQILRRHGTSVDGAGACAPNTASSSAGVPGRPSFGPTMPLPDLLDISFEDISGTEMGSPVPSEPRHSHSLNLGPNPVRFRRNDPFGPSLNSMLRPAAQPQGLEEDHVGHKELSAPAPMLVHADNDEVAFRFSKS